MHDAVSQPDKQSEVSVIRVWQRPALRYALALAGLLLVLAGIFGAGVALGQQSARVQPVPGAAQDFEVRFDNYSAAQRQIVLDHVAVALSNLPEGASEFEIAAAINDYLYQYYNNSADSSGSGAADYLAGGQSFCGGTVVSMAEMLYAVDIRSKYAYVHGGLNAHSMVEVFFSDGTRGLFDPHLGYLYYDASAQRPVSMVDILAGADLNTVIFYSSQPKQAISGQIVPLSEVFSSYLDHDVLDRDFDPVALFTRMDGAGVANEGYKDYVEVVLEPGELLGEAAWSPASESPTPWHTLAIWQEDNGDYLSWVYMLGQTLGYNINHIYRLENLTPGRTYTLRHAMARGYANPALALDGPVITIQPVDPFRPGLFSHLPAFSPSLDESYAPQVHEFSFEATTTEVSVIYNVEGIILVTAVELLEE